MLSSATQPPPPPYHNFVSAITFEGFFKLDTCITHPNISDEFDNYLAPGGGCEVLFSPGLSVCVSVCLCVCVCICVSGQIFWYFIARLLEEISI